MSGVFWAVAAGFGFGMFQALHRKAGQNLDAARGTFTLLAVSSIILIAAAALTSDVSLLQSASLGAILAFAVAGFLHFFIGWTLIGISQSQIGAARTGAVVGTMPLFGLMIDLGLYHETFSTQALVGVFLVVAGVFIISYR